MHGQIAVPMEYYCKKYDCKEYSADDIECGMFYTAAVNILESAAAKDAETQTQVASFRSSYINLQERSFFEIQHPSPPYQNQHYDLLDIFNEFKSILKMQ